MADQFLFTVQSEVSGRGAAGDDQRSRIQPFIVGFDSDMLVARIEIGHFRVGKPGAEFFGLVCACSESAAAHRFRPENRDNFLPAWSWKAARQAAGLPAPTD